MSITRDIMIPAMLIRIFGPFRSLYLRSTPFQNDTKYRFICTLSPPCNLYDFFFFHLLYYASRIKYTLIFYIIFKLLSYYVAVMIYFNLLVTVVVHYHHYFRVDGVRRFPLGD